VTRPQPDEYHEYYETYVKLVPQTDVLPVLRAGIDQTHALFAGRPASFADHRYAPDKWSVRDVLGHLIDGERVFGFRAFWFARKGDGALPSFDQDVFVTESRSTTRSLESLFDEWRLVRASNLAFFETVTDAESVRTGLASGRPFSVRAFPWITAGHEIHHRNILAERYLSS
jgi:hypothetical protein